MEENQEIKETPPQTPPKQGNGSKIAIIILAILATAGLGFGIYGFFFKKPSTSEAIDILSQDDLTAISVVSDTKELPTQDTTNQEITITNPYILRDLNHKFAALNGFNYETESNQFQTAPWAYNDAVKLYNGNDDYSFLGSKAIISELKPASAWSSFYNGLSDALKNYLNELNSKYNLSEVSYDTVAATGFVPYEQANRAYHDLAGTDSDLAKSDYGTATCTVYHYIAEADGFAGESFGCGGAGYGSFMVRKDSFKAKGDEAYVYMHLISTSGVDHDDESGRDVCHVLDGWTTNIDGNGTEERSELDKFSPDSIWCTFPNNYATEHSSLFDQAQAYRFVFKKNSEGIYAFSKVEKL